MYKRQAIKRVYLEVRGAELGLDSAPISAGYVAGWAKEADGAAIEAAAEHVAKTSHAIAEALQLTAQ